MKFQLLSRSLLASTLITAVSFACAAEPLLPTDRRCGSTDPHLATRIDFIMYFKTLDQATSAAAGIDEEQFEIEVREAAGAPDWLVRPAYRSVPSFEAHEENWAALEALTKQLGGTFAGSGCSIPDLAQ